VPLPGPLGDTEFFGLFLDRVADHGGGAVDALEFMAELLEFGAAGHQAGELVAGDLGFLVVAEGPAAVEQQEPVSDRIGVVRVCG
jgi:hypothetical protein